MVLTMKQRMVAINTEKGISDSTAPLQRFTDLQLTPFLGFQFHQMQRRMRILNHFLLIVRKAVTVNVEGVKTSRRSFRRDAT
jgi:hypothetical protein